MAAKKTSPVEADRTEARTASATKKTSAKKPAAAKRPGRVKLAVRSGEKPWTAMQIAEIRATLQSDAERLQAEIASAESEISQLLREGGEGAGHDQADVGSSTFERDQEMTMARNARENLSLVEAALTRIDKGNYGVCASCGQPIGKARLLAFPRATLCMECKQRQERR